MPTRPIAWKALALVCAVALPVITGCSASTGGAPPAAAPTETTSIPAQLPPPSAAPTTPRVVPSPVAVPSTSPVRAIKPASSAAPATSTAATSSTAPRPTPSLTPAGTPAPAPTALLPMAVPGRPTVLLNPGHNGGNAARPDLINRQVPAGFGAHKECDTTGTATDAGYAEHAYTWDVVLRVRRILTAHGLRVLLTRPDDRGVGPCVDRRAAMGNTGAISAVVSIHGDGAPSSGHGFFACTAGRRPAGASRAVLRDNVVLARALRDALVGGSGLTTSNYLGTNGVYRTTKFAALNLATRPAAFLEIGNMRNAGDAARQSSAAGRERIARAVAAGIVLYLRRR